MEEVSESGAEDEPVHSVISGDGGHVCHLGTGEVILHLAQQDQTLPSMCFRLQ